MKNVKIDSGCISCGSCEFVAPEVFEVLDVAHLKKNVDIEKYKNEIKKAASLCPVSVIKYSENNEK